MARGRAVSHALAVLLHLLLFLVSAVAASPASDTRRQDSWAQTVPTTNSHANTAVTGGGWNVASIIGISVGIVVVLLVILSLSNSFYHSHASLRIHQQLLERISHIAQYTPPIDAPDTGAGAGAGAGAGRPHAPWRMTPGVASDAYHLALLMSSTAHLSPTMYSAIQEQIHPRLLNPPAPAAETKMRAPVTEDKVLGRREDIESQGRQSEQAAGVEGQIPSFPRLAY